MPVQIERAIMPVQIEPGIRVGYPGVWQYMKSAARQAWQTFSRMDRRRLQIGSQPREKERLRRPGQW
jgi:hypothetical protein